MDEWVWSIVGMILKGKTEVLGEKPVLVPHCTPWIPRGLVRDRTRLSSFTLQCLIAGAMAQSLPIKKKFCLYIWFLSRNIQVIKSITNNLRNNSQSTVRHTFERCSSAALCWDFLNRQNSWIIRRLYKTLIIRRPTGLASVLMCRYHGNRHNTTNTKCRTAELQRARDIPRMMNASAMIFTEWHCLCGLQWQD
jgi:hypothetical protein